MSDPYDKAFKLTAEEEDLGLLRVIAKFPVPANARVEHLDRELDLATLHVDHLYRITESDQSTTVVHMEAFSRYDSDWRRRHSRYAALIWAKYEAKLMSFMFLLTDKEVPKELEGQLEIDAGDLELRLRVRIVRLWELPAKELLDTANPALLAWVPLTNATQDDVRKAAAGVAASGDPELHSRMALLYGMRYVEIEVLETMLTEEMLKDSAYYQKILKKGLEEGREKGMQEGREKGMQEGRERGMQEGRERGMQEGRQEGMQQGLERGLEEGLGRGIEKGIEKGIERGLEQGIEKGRQQGFVEGERQLLRRQLIQKFGPLPELVVERLRHASEAEIERWGTQLLSTNAIEEALA